MRFDARIDPLTLVKASPRIPKHSFSIAALLVAVRYR
jgi:hypothetical protein